MSGADYLTFFGYFAIFCLVGYWFGRGEKADEDAYFLANRSLPWFVIGGSYVASNISAEHFIGQVAAACLFGIVVAMSDWAAILVFSILIWLFIPFLIASRVFTIPEYLEQRFGIVLRQSFAIVTIIANIVAFLSAVLYAGGLALHHIFGWDLTLSIVFLALASGVWTIYGGFRSVAWTDFFTLFIMISGGLCVTWFGLQYLGGSDGGLLEGLSVVIERNRADAGVWQEAVNHSMPHMLPGYDSYDRLNIIQPVSHPLKPWTQLLFGVLHMGIWYNVLNQFIIQRVFAAKNAYHARMGIVFAGYLKLLMPLLTTLPGLILFALHPEILMQDWRVAQQQADQGYTALIRELMPAGFAGIVLAALFAAIQSTVNSVLNSTSTVFTMDVYKRMFRPGATGTELVRVGVITTIVVMLISIALALMIERMGGEVFLYIQTLYAFFAPPFAAVFLLGILWRRINAVGATAAVFVGFAFSILLKLHLHTTWFTALLPHAPSWMLPFANQATLNWLVSLCVCIIVSCVTEPQQRISDTVVMNWKTLDLRTGLGSTWYNHVLFWWGLWSLCVLGVIFLFSGLLS